MAKDDDEFTSQLPMSPEDVSKALSASLPGIDASRASGLAQLGGLRDAKARSLSREQTLLTLKHGGAPHPRLAEAQQRFTVNEQLRREVAVMRELAETPAVEPRPDAMIVHGFVRRRSDHAGLPGLTLALTDAEGNWVRALGYACTDARGYFRLDIAAPSETEPKSAASRREAASAAAEAPARSLQLRVFDSKGHVLHTEKRPVALRAGRIDYRYILLGDDAAQCACTPPPATSGGRPATVGPKAPTETPPPATTRPGTGTPQPEATSRVGGLRAYQQPAPATSAAGTPLEAIRGVGPKSAEKLRQAGIADVEHFEKTPGATFVKLAGFDKAAPKPAPTEPKPAARKTPSKKRK